MLYTVKLFEVHEDNTETEALAYTTEARRSLKLHREHCAIGRAKVRDGEWKRWKAERVREGGDIIQCVLSGVAGGELSAEVR